MTESVKNQICAVILFSGKRIVYTAAEDEKKLWNDGLQKDILLYTHTKCVNCETPEIFAILRAVTYTTTKPAA